MERTYATQADYKLKPEFCETIEGETLTEQNQTLTLREILERSGNPQLTIQDGVFSDDPEDFDQEDLQQLKNADILVREETRKRTRKKLQSLEDEEEERKAAEAKAAEEAERLEKERNAVK